MSTEDVAIRRATDNDLAEMIELCQRSLGWDAGGVDEAFFRWKHVDNPAGPSPSWVATAPTGEIVGVRVFMRWRFQEAGKGLMGVRAVDTATAPEWRGRGVFSRLTLGALPGLSDDGVDFVFNTPNDQSRPGYLKMGWELVGRMPFGVRFRPGAIRFGRSLMAPADRWGEDTSVGDPAAAVLGTLDLAGLIGTVVHARPGLATRVDPDWLTWRYRFPQLNYRAVPLDGSDPSNGLIIFRLRRRGPAIECTVCETLAPKGADLRRPLRELLRATGADLLLVAPQSGIATGTIPAPMGPRLTWKPLCRAGVPDRSDLHLTLGDLELF